MISRYRDLPAPPGILNMTTSLDQMVAAVGKRQRELDPDEPHLVLARLRLPLYVTASPDSELADALAEVGAKPEVEFSRWKEDLTDYETYPSIYDTQKDYRPTVERPLVYHLFGVLKHPDSLVLTEDNFFDYLMWVSRTDAIPRAVTAAWSRDALLFLGLRMDDWSFRVLFRSILNEERRRRPRAFRSAAVQVNPNDVHRDPG